MKTVYIIVADNNIPDEEKFFKKLFEEDIFVMKKIVPESELVHIVSGRKTLHEKEDIQERARFRDFER